MDKIVQLWEAISGKKTAFGAAALWAAWFLVDVVIGEWHSTAEWVPMAVQALEWIGGVLVPGGLVHKGWKTRKRVANQSGRRT